ncbi:uncharacterized protein (TIGR02594 family) [Neisseria sp. HSC-16F19]|nr:TIGR02594 family protein [Neisseria sp. HSC-16F19]MCP2041454.1 uncharacterized protein (TIGR02594 family) [Neisseria sp. HSC-16F19]
MAQTKELPWVAEARRHIGLAEVPGKQHNPVIVQWLMALKAWWRDDETPWCGTFVAHCCRVAGRTVPQHWYRALAWTDAGMRLSKPAYGCVVVFGRKGGGHVGFVVGQTESGDLLVLGGNQGNQVSVARFPRARALAYVWPGVAGRRAVPDQRRYALPVLKHTGGYSRNEA